MGSGGGLLTTGLEIGADVLSGGTLTPELMALNTGMDLYNGNTTGALLNVASMGLGGGDIGDAGNFAGSGDFTGDLPIDPNAGSGFSFPTSTGGFDPNSAGAATDPFGSGGMLGDALTGSGNVGMTPSGGMGIASAGDTSGLGNLTTNTGANLGSATTGMTGITNSAGGISDSNLSNMVGGAQGAGALPMSNLTPQYQSYSNFDPNSGAFTNTPPPGVMPPSATNLTGMNGMTSTGADSVASNPFMSSSGGSTMSPGGGSFLSRLGDYAQTPGGALRLGALGLTGAGAVQNYLTGQQERKALSNSVSNAYPYATNAPAYTSFTANPMAYMQANSPGFNASQQYIQQASQRANAANGYNNSGFGAALTATNLGNNANSWYNSTAQNLGAGAGVGQPSGTLGVSAMGATLPNMVGTLAGAGSMTSGLNDILKQMGYS